MKWTIPLFVAAFPAVGTAPDLAPIHGLCSPPDCSEEDIPEDAERCLRVILLDGVDVASMRFRRPDSYTDQQWCEWMNDIIEEYRERAGYESWEVTSASYSL